MSRFIVIILFSMKLLHADMLDLYMMGVLPSIASAKKQESIVLSAPHVAYNGINTPCSVFLDGVRSVTGLTLISPSGVRTTLTYQFDPASGSSAVDASIPAGLTAGAYDIEIATGTGNHLRALDALEITNTLSLAVTAVSPYELSTAKSTEITVVLDEQTSSLPPHSLPELYLVPTPAEATGEPVPLRGVAMPDPATLTAAVPRDTPVGTYDLVVVGDDGSVGLLPDAVEVFPDTLTIGGLAPMTVPAYVTTTVRAECSNFDCTTASVVLECSDGSAFQMQAAGSASEVSFEVPSGTINDTLCSVVVITASGRTVRYDSLLIKSIVPSTSWTQSSAPMSQARNHPAVTAGKSGSRTFLYALGGDDLTHALGSVEFAPFDRFGNFGVWSVSKRPLPLPITHTSAVTVGDFIYLAGGSNGTAVLDTLYRAPILQPENLPEIDSLVPVPSAGEGVGEGEWVYSVAALFPPDDPVNPSGESLPGQRTNVEIPAGSRAVDISLVWSEVTGAAGYRVYRNEPGDTGTMHWLAEVATASFTDTGTVTDASRSPMQQGDLGTWHPVGSGLNVPRELSGFTAVKKVGSDTEFVLYAVGGSNMTDSALASYEYADLTIEPNGTQSLTPFAVGTSTLQTARTNLDVAAATSEDVPAVPSGESWLYIGSGTGANVFESGRIDTAGDLTDLSEINRPGPSLPWYAMYVSDEYLIVNTANNSYAAVMACNAGICSLGTWNNAANPYVTQRSSAGRTQYGHFLFAAGGNDTTQAWDSTEMSLK